MTRSLLSLFCLVWLCSDNGPSAALSDTVTDWNLTFLRAIRDETTHPCLASRNLAILHVALFDAANAVSGKYRPYCSPRQPTRGASEEAAATVAGHRIASFLYPSHHALFDELLTNTLASIHDESAKAKGVQLGQQAADAILKLRQDDGATTTMTYVPSTEPGHWRRTPPYYRPPECPQWAFVTPFALTNGHQFRPAPPPGLGSGEYLQDLEEVQGLGGKQTTARTPEQTLIARFWSDFSYTVTPPGHWNDITRGIVLSRRLPLIESARVFALLNIAMADAGIACWDAKYSYDFWRPVTAIRQARLSKGSDAASSDWEPLLPTPAFPEYTSGHSTFSGAAAAVLSQFFGTDKVDFEIGCDALPGVIRSFHSFQATAEEIGRSRIYGGIHFSSADKNGREMGKAVGNYVALNFLVPMEATNGN